MGSSGRSAFPELPAPPPLAADTHARLVLRVSSIDPDAAPFDVSPAVAERIHFTDSRPPLVTLRSLCRLVAGRQAYRDASAAVAGSVLGPTMLDQVVRWRHSNLSCLPSPPES